VHVLCEKPIAHTVAAADRMLAAAQRHGIVLGMDFQMRTSPTYRQARELVQQGALGELVRVSVDASTWYRVQAYYASGVWRGTWDLEGGGVIMNQAPHTLDMYIWLAGLPRRVRAAVCTRIHQIEVENTVAALLEHGPERIDTFYTTTAEWPGRNEFVLVGERGRLEIQGGRLRLYRMAKSLREELLHSPHGTRPAGAWEDVPVEPAEPERTGHIEVLRQFVRAIREGAPLVATGEDGRRALELANAMLLAGYRNQVVDIPVDRAAYDTLLADLQAEAQRRRASGELPARVLGPALAAPPPGA